MLKNSLAREAIVSRLFERQERVDGAQASVVALKEIRQQIEVTKELILMTLQGSPARTNFLISRVMPLIRDNDSIITAVTQKEESIFYYALDELRDEDRIYMSHHGNSGEGWEYALKISESNL